MSKDKLQPIRDKIDAIDLKLLSLIQKRGNLAHKVGEIKGLLDKNASLYRPDREAEILRNLAKLNNGVISDKKVRSIFKEVISACLSLEEELTIAYLGPRGTHSEAALVQHFGSSVKDDPRIGYIVLKLDNIQGTGQTVLFDLGQALKKAKDSGKKILAIGDSYSQSAYYLASYADEVIVNPDGAVLIEGYSRYRNYYKSFLDKLKISINLFKVGSYKSAMEPFIRDTMSAEDKEASMFWMGDLWSSWKEDVSINRGLEPADIQFYADNANILIKDQFGDMAKAAKKANLIDKILNRTQIREYLEELVGSNSEQGNESFDNISINEYWQVIESEKDKPNLKNIALIVAKCEIV